MHLSINALLEKKGLKFISYKRISDDSDAFIFIYKIFEDEEINEDEINKELHELIFNEINVSYCNYSTFHSECDEFYLMIESDEIRLN